VLLYTYPGSPICRPIAMFIADCQIDVEQKVVDLLAGEQFEPAFTAINPNNAVPVLDHGPFRLTESSAILKYLADVVESPAYPKPLQARARVNAAMDWVNTGLYRNFGYNFCYPQVLAHLKWPDPTTQSLVLASGRDGARKFLAVMNDHLLGGRNRWLCGEQLTIADYFGSGILSLGELTGYDFAEWPHIRRWYRQIQDLSNWQSANAALYAWAKAVKGPEYLQL
jgi:glutathione S-transferase